jgi:hypothetical protein
MCLVTHDTDVDRLLVEEDSDVGALRRRAALERLTLRQRSDGRRSPPVWFIEAAIDVDRPRGALCHGDWRVRPHAVWLLSGRRRSDKPPNRDEQRRGPA